MRALLEATQGIDRGLVVSARGDDHSIPEIQRELATFTEEARRFKDWMMEGYFSEILFKDIGGDAAPEVAGILWWAWDNDPLAKKVLADIESLGRNMEAMWNQFSKKAEYYQKKALSR